MIKSGKLILFVLLLAFGSFSYAESQVDDRTLNQQ